MFYTDTMSKKPKKRTNRYQGEDAKHRVVSSEPVVHRYEAVERSKLGEWWQPKKRFAKIGAIAAAGITGITWLLVELFQLVF